MKKNSSFVLFAFILIISTLIVISSTNWLSMWMGLEMNMISFIPIMYKKYDTSVSKSIMTYFLIQSMGSVVFLLTIIINYMMSYDNHMINNLFTSMITISMLIKLGAAPFHFWFPEVMSQLTWFNCLILMTWQKLAPLSIISIIAEHNNWLMIIVMACTMIGAIGGLNQIEIRKLMAFSSINHLGWMLSSMKLENQMWIQYFTVYAALIMLICSLMMIQSTFMFNQMMFGTTFLQKLTFISLMMSLGGLPPFIGFYPKWLIIQSMMHHSLYLILFIMVMSTLITLFYYLRMSSLILMFQTSEFKLNMKMKHTNMYLYILLLNMMMPIVIFMP